MLTAYFTKCNNKTVWVSGKCAGHNFEAMLMDIQCQAGINKGRVLELYMPGIAIYNFGWQLEPEPDNVIFNAVLKLLQEAPKRFY